jgi:hypothetical protein
MKALGLRGLEFGGPKFDVRIHGAQIRKTAVPKLIEIRWARIDALVRQQFFVGKVKGKRHG